jgi:hypothetical protein
MHVKLQSFLSDFLDNLINHSYSNPPTPLPHDKDWYGRIIPWKDLCPTLKFSFKWYLIWGNLLPPSLRMTCRYCTIVHVNNTIYRNIYREYITSTRNYLKKIILGFLESPSPPFLLNPAPPPPHTPTTTDWATIVHLINSPYRII